MRAAVLHEHGATPQVGDFDDPGDAPDCVQVQVVAAGLHHLDLHKATGSFYMGPPPLPSAVGTDGVGTLEDGRRVYFDETVQPFGSMAEKALARAFHPRPRPPRAAAGPVDDVKVKLRDPQPLQAPMRLGLRVLPRGKELGGDEDLIARHAAVAQRTADALLIAVRLRGVHVPVAQLERPANGVLRLRAVWHLPDAEAELGNLVAVCQGARASVCRHGA